MDFVEAVERLQPGTASTLRKLAIWTAIEAQAAPYPLTRVRTAAISARFAAEASRIEWQLQCPERGGSRRAD